MLAFAALTPLVLDFSLCYGIISYAQNHIEPNDVHHLQYVEEPSEHVIHITHAEKFQRFVRYCIQYS